MQKAVLLSLAAVLCATTAVQAAGEPPHTRPSALSTERKNGQVEAGISNGAGCVEYWIK
jgi:hypothetical protein